jgi:copper chaperone CopZ
MTKFIVVATLLVLALAGCSTGGDLKSETITVSSAVCGSCGETVEKAVYAVEGVKEAKFDLETKALTVSYVPEQTNLATLERAVSDAGYDANSTKRDPAAYEKLDACCKID